MKTEILKFFENFEILNFNFFYITYVFQYYYLNIKILKFYEN